MIKIKSQNNIEKKLATVNEISEMYDISVGSIRQFIFNRNENGFNECVQKTKRPMLIDTNLFEKWISERKDKKENRMNNKKINSVKQYDNLAKLILKMQSNAKYRDLMDEM